MLGVGVLHLVPHAWEQFRSADLTMAWVLVGFLVMFFVQRYLHFHHHDVPEEAPERRGSEEGGASFDHDPGHAHEEHGGALTLAANSARHWSWMGAAFGLLLHLLLGGVALAARVQLY